MKYRYKMEIAYDGSRYQGWQRLGNTDRTIQGKIEGVLTRYMCRDMEIDGSGRTDAGVHALCQTASFETVKEVDEVDLVGYFAKYLPEDIQVSKVSLEDSDFHGRYSVRSKTYKYVINNNDYRDVFNRKYQWHIDERLDVGKMKTVAGIFPGSHDFTAFTTVKSKKKSMVRNIRALDIAAENGIIYIRVEADGFLHNMVRKIVGLLVEAGLGKLTLEEAGRILMEKDRAAIAYMAPAHGLFLERVDY